MLVNLLITEPGLGRFLLLCCFRDDEVATLLKIAQGDKVNNIFILNYNHLLIFNRLPQVTLL